MTKFALMTGVLLMALSWVSYFDAATARCAGGAQAVMGRCPNGAYAPATQGQNRSQLGPSTTDS